VSTTAGFTHTGANPAHDVTPPAHGPPHIHLYDVAFTTGALTFSGPPGAAGPGTDFTVAHEVGHMVMGRAVMAANARINAALATVNALAGSTPLPPAALTAWNAWGPAQQTANARIVAYQRAANTGAGNVGGRLGQPDISTFRAPAAAAITARNTARAALAPAGVPAAMVAAAAALDAANDAMLAAGDQVPTFVALATRFGFNRFTDYAQRQANDEDWFAETHALFVTDPDRLFGMSRAMFIWFQQGMPMNPAWNPPPP
jgi:hypothetical protein